jgi:hypothetical protein
MDEARAFLDGCAPIETTKSEFVVQSATSTLGRHHGYTEELGEQICGLVEAGKTLAEIEVMSGMPSKRCCAGSG